MLIYDLILELLCFNQYCFVELFVVLDEILLVVNEVLRLGELSDGVFDVIVGLLVNFWGFGLIMCFEIIFSEEDVVVVREYVGLDKLQV